MKKSRKRRGCHSYDGTHGRYPFVSGRAQKTGTVSVWIFHGDGTYAGEFPCKTCKKNADMIVANNLKVAGAGFGTDTNVVTLITADDCRELEIMSKADVASAIVSEILKKMC